MAMGGWYIAKFLGSLLAGFMGAYWLVIPPTAFFGLGMGSTVAAAACLFADGEGRSRPRRTCRLRPRDMSGLATPHGPYLIFLGDITEPAYAKTAMGLRDWAPERCVGELALGGSAVSVGLPKLSPSEAHAKGARALLIGVATPGGLIPAHWVPILVEALDAGLDIVSGMHARLSEVPGLADAARLTGRQLIDVRVPPSDIPVGTRAARDRVAGC